MTKMSFCLQAATTLSQDDLDPITDAIETYTKAGVPALEAERHATRDALAALQTERAELVEAMVEQLPKQMEGVDAERLMEPQRSVDRTDTPEFKKWFDGSQVVDEDGKPRVVYHGTIVRDNARAPGMGDITAFDRMFTTQFRKPSLDTIGSWFSTNPGKGGAEMYSGAGEGSAIYPVHLAIKNPQVTTFQLMTRRARLLHNGKDDGRMIGAPEVEAYRKWLGEMGKDGIKIESSGNDGSTEFDNQDAWIALEPEQIKSATGNSGGFDSTNADITRSADRSEFYSPLQRAIAGVPDRLATMAAPQWKLWLDANASKLGVKKDEIEWSGVLDYLALRGKDKVTRDEVGEFLGDNGVKVQETVLGTRQNLSDLAPSKRDVVMDILRRYDNFGFDNVDDALDEFYESPRSLDLYEDDLEALDSALGSSARKTKYAQYVVPGGTNYREVLITLPAPAEKYRVVEQPEEAEYAKFAVFDGKGLVNAFARRPQAEARAEQLNAKSIPVDSAYKSSHWDQPNILAHLRVDDRTDADGKRVLFINEVQSDWGQDGKKKGFDQATKKLEPQVKPGEQAALVDRMRAVAIERMVGKGVDQEVAKNVASGLGHQALADMTGMKAEHQELLDRMLADRIAEEQINKVGSPVPSGPFVTDTKAWVGLALKRAIMMAVDGGYERVALISGEQAADLYDLSKTISAVSFKASWTDGEQGTLEAWDAMRKQVISERMLPSQVEDYIGKEAARKLLDQKPAMMSYPTYVLDGVDLKVGGEGMKAFYDTIVPQVARDVLKKLGGGQLVDITMLDANSVPSETYRVGDDGNGGYAVIRRASGEQLSAHDTRPEAKAAMAKLVSGEPSTQPGFDITPELRARVQSGVPLFSRERLLDTALLGGYTLGDLATSTKKIGWWDKTVGTPYHLAQKHPTFKRVFDAVQNFLGDVSRYASRASDQAPNILPKLESLRDITKRPLSKEDAQALIGPVFGGTLSFKRDAKGNAVETDDVGAAGVVWKPEELKARFGLDDRQIGLYREVRNAINRSLNDLAVSHMVRYAGADGAAVRAQMLEAKNASAAADILEDHLAAAAIASPGRSDSLQNTAKVVREQADQVRGLIARGYAPLSRFGDYTVYVTRDDGKEQVFFGMFETEREANKAARQFRESGEFSDAKIEVGTMSKESYKLFSGVTPETMALFGESLGLEQSGDRQQDQVFQAYIKLAKNNRSAMKRMIERKGVKGYSEDVSRVLAGFVYSGARQASQNLHSGEITKAASLVPEGDLKDHAIKLTEYVQNPQEEAQALRGFLFAQYIGGSLASAVTNLTQSITTTLPVLSQHFGIAKSSHSMAAALQVASNGAGADKELGKAMERAEAEGITAPQETHQLQAQAAGKGALQSGDGTVAGEAAAIANNGVARVQLAWGKMFGWAEQMNRKVAFAAAFKLARERGMVDPYEFAKKIVAETQFVMNKGNNPMWARGPVGATLFTFRKFMINYLEGLARMWTAGEPGSPERAAGRRAFALSLAMLFMLAGTAGFPFAEDLDDLVDFFAQRVLGKNFSSKQAKEEWFASILGDAGAQFVTRGISGLPGVPIDVSNRLGLGNIAPGSGLAQTKRDHTRDLYEIAGAGGDFVKRMIESMGLLAEGDVTNAMANASPTALRNVYQAVAMAQRGYYTDMKGRKVIDTTMGEAAMKLIGFQPNSVARIQDAAGQQTLAIDRNKIAEAKIADLMARGRIERKPEMIKEAMERNAEWNRDNPTSPISISADQINKRVREANMTKAQRIEKTAPKEIRAGVKRELEIER